MGCLGFTMKTFGLLMIGSKSGMDDLKINATLMNGRGVSGYYDDSHRLEDNE